MGSTEGFAHMLREFMELRHYTPRLLAERTDIPEETIKTWLKGRGGRVREWQRVVCIAAALDLNWTQTQRIMRAAGTPSITLNQTTLASWLTTLQHDAVETMIIQWLASLDQGTPTEVAASQTGDSDSDRASPPQPTSGGWERGQHRPQDPEQVLCLAEELAPAPAETDQLLHAAGLPPAHDIPIPRPARHQLRPPIADFVGRTTEIAQLEQALQTAVMQGRGAIISGVQGMGGIGKTELAYLVAQRLIDTFPDAQIVVPLRGTSPQPLSPEQALRSVIHAFTPEARLPDDLVTLQAHYQSVLHEKRVLILADDTYDAAQVRPLIPPMSCALLMTSRQRFTLPGMATVDLDQLAEADAIAFLHSIAPRLSTADALALAQACGYLPLALRVSGGLLLNTPALKIATYLAQLRDTRQRLASLRDPDDPGLDVAASLHLSYTQLDAITQSVFRQLGVLSADFAIELALAVVEAPEGVDVETTLHGLLRRNLVMYDAARDRWRLHDLVCDLAQRELEGAGAWEQVMWRYARAAVALTAHIKEQYLVGGERAVLALARFDAERAHIDAARRWAQLHMETSAGDQLLIDAVLAARDIQNLRYDQRREIIPLWEGVLTAARRLGSRRAEAHALGNLGIAYYYLGELHTAIPYYDQSLAIARELGDHRDESHTLGNLGVVYTDLGQLHTGISYYEQVLAIDRELGDRRAEARDLGNLGVAYYELGELSKTIIYQEQALAIAREFGDYLCESIALGLLGNVYTDLGDLRRAIEACEEASSIARVIGDRRSEGYALSYLARAQALQGDRVRATTTFIQARTLFQEVGDRSGEAECNLLFGLALTQQGERKRALPLLRIALTYRQEIGHAKAAEHAALVARLEAGGELPPELHIPTNQQAIGGDSEKPTGDSAQP